MNGTDLKNAACNLVGNITSGIWTTFQTPSRNSILECVIIILITVGIILVNMLMIAVLHCRNHHRFLKGQPRFLMTSLAVSDLAVGTLVTPFSIYPALFRCWPFGNTACAIEALLISALFHQSFLSLMCIAIDRYICIVHPLRYQRMVTRKVCVSMIITCWMTSFSVYCTLIYPRARYVFDTTGTLTCEPYYSKQDIIFSAVGLFFFPPFVITTYCYAAIFFVAKKQIEKVKLFAITASSCTEYSRKPDKVIGKERLKSFQTSFGLGLMALGFGLAITPWNLTMLISSCMEITVPRDIMFVMTWVAMSNCFWNPIIYGVMNKSFRILATDILKSIFRCFKH